MATEFDYVNLGDDQEHYGKAYESHMKRMFPKDARGAWVPMVLNHELLKTCITRLEQSREPLNVLGIGSGAGDDDCKLIAGLLEMYSKISNTAVEPNKGHIMRYQETVSSSEHLLRADWDWRQQGWEEYIPHRGANNDSSKFHVITSIHSSYYFLHNLEQTIDEVLECLHDDGVLVIVRCNRDAGGFKVLNWNDNRHYNGYSISCPDIREILEKKGLICYNGIFPEYSDVTDFFERSDESDVNLLVDFMTHVVNFRETAPSKVYDEFTKRMHDPEMTFRKDGRIYMDVGSDVIIAKNK